MSADFAFTEDQRDCLQEVINVAIGRAGDTLARFLKVFVRLSVPRIRLMAANQLVGLVESPDLSDVLVSVVRQGFSGVSRLDIRGEGVAIYTGTSFRELADLLGHGEGDADLSEAELLCDISSMLMGSCLSNIAQQFAGEVVFSAPSTLLLQRPLPELTELVSIEWEAALLIEIDYTLERGTFRCTVALLMPNDAVARLGTMVDKLLEAM